MDLSDNDSGVDDIEDFEVVSVDDNFNNINDIELDDEDVGRAPKRYIRDAQNPLEFYDNGEFKRRYRFNKDSVLYGILPKIEIGLEKVNNRGLPIVPELQLLMTLRYYATASFQVLKKNF